VLAIALVNGVGEELFFRGALRRLPPRSAVFGTTIVM
jgi:membrane protease YdiL (CAAX protease family)